MIQISDIHRFVIKFPSSTPKCGGGGVGGLGMGVGWGGMGRGGRAEGGGGSPSHVTYPSMHF